MFFLNFYVLTSSQSFKILSFSPLRFFSPKHFENLLFLFSDSVINFFFSIFQFSGSVAPRQLTDVAKSKRTFERNQFRHAKVRVDYFYLYTVEHSRLLEWWHMLLPSSIYFFIISFSDMCSTIVILFSF